jgi:hypothetical protein
MILVGASVGIAPAHRKTEATATREPLQIGGLGLEQTPLLS